MDFTSLPQLISQHAEIAALILALASIPLAWLARRIAHALVAAIERLFSRLVPGPGSDRIGESSTVAGHVSFWLVLVLMLVVALRLVGSGALAQLLDQLLGFTPKLIIAAVILGVGFVLSLAVRNTAVTLGGIPADHAGARAAQAMVLVLAFMTAIEQLGIGVSFITNLIIVAGGLLLGGVVLAFALGARTWVGNLLAFDEVNRYAVGDRLEVGGVVGEVLDIHRTGVVLSCEDGLVSIPGQWFAEMKVRKLPHES